MISRTATDLCTFPGCLGTVVARGYCMKHYARLRRTGTVERLERRTKRCRWCDALYAGYNKVYCSMACFAAAKTHPRINGAKQCCWCREWKPLDEFYAAKNHGGDGHLSHCKACHTVYSALRRKKALQERPDETRARRREYYRAWKERKRQG